jgi:hypothetical protein
LSTRPLSNSFPTCSQLKLSTTILFSLLVGIVTATALVDHSETLDFVDIDETADNSHLLEARNPRRWIFSGGLWVAGVVGGDIFLKASGSGKPINDGIEAAKELWYRACMKRDPNTSTSIPVDLTKALAPTVCVTTTGKTVTHSMFLSPEDLGSRLCRQQQGDYFDIVGFYSLAPRQDTEDRHVWPFSVSSCWRRGHLCGGLQECCSMQKGHPCSPSS